MTYSKEVPTHEVCDIGCLCMEGNILTNKDFHTSPLHLVLK